MIAATIDPGGVGAIDWDVLVIGAGPAGAAAAVRLVRLGRRVLLVDRCRFPRPKVCGCCLSPAAVRELALLDLPRGCRPGSVPLDSVWIAAAGRQARIATAGGATLSRETLDSSLVRAAIDAGAAWLPAATVMELAESRTGLVATVREASGESVAVRAGLVVIAAGLADAIRVRRPSVCRAASVPRPRRIAPASFIGLGTTLPADVGPLPGGTLVMGVGTSGYAGIVRLEDGRIDVAAAVDPASVAATGSPAATIDALLAEVGGIARSSVPPGAIGAAAVWATPALTHTTPLTAGDAAIVRIGDAAAYVEPFTGEGIGWALAGARVLAEAVATTRSAAELGAAFRAAHARVFAAHHARCRGVAAAVRWPWLCGGAVRAAGVAPRIAARVVPWLVGGGALR